MGGYIFKGGYNEKDPIFLYGLRKHQPKVGFETRPPESACHVDGGINHSAIRALFCTHLIIKNCLNQPENKRESTRKSKIGWYPLNMPTELGNQQVTLC